MKYDFNSIEKKWQQYWAANNTFKAVTNSDKEKFYVLDMFPYPSGAGLHVGHPLGYIASDIYARYKRHKGFNVLHPQGYDSFGLPAEQYAIQTGQHPAVTTAENIATYRRQLDQLGFSFDWSREIKTSDPAYYKWTQWIFIQLFNSWYDKEADKAVAIELLVALFDKEGNSKVSAVCDDTTTFSAAAWQAFSNVEKQQILLKYRIAYLAESEVNWCPALGTVLANDEIINGVSERGGHPVIRKKMTQWSMRIAAYAQRLLDGLQGLDWPQPLKDSQTNWIGKSVGASVTFNVISEDINKQRVIDVFTTRPDTIFGVSFMTLAPEHPLVLEITTPEQKEAVTSYITATAKRSERARMADVKSISGAFTGAFAEHPLTKKPIPIWIGDYVLAGYGTGAVMSVPCGDQRDHDFAKYFNIAIPNIFDGVDVQEEAFTDKQNTVITNSDFLDGLKYKKASEIAIKTLETLGQGAGKTNYRLRDAVFSRQRYWGEPFPVYYDADGLPQIIDAAFLPLELPEVATYLPTETGAPPLGNAEKWHWLQEKSFGKVVSREAFEEAQITARNNGNTIQGGALELNTMPGWAGSSQYFNRYMDPHNTDEIFSEEAIEYWQDVDLYIGGSEHATGHLLYARFWQKFMFDKGLVPKDEFAKKLINQGMITGTSAFIQGATVSVQIDWEDEVASYLSTEIQDELDARTSNNLWISAPLVADRIALNRVTAAFLIKEYTRLNTYIKAHALPIANIQLEIAATINLKRHVDVSFVDASDALDVVAFKNWRSEYNNAELFLDEDGSFKVTREVEKMSKSKFNVVNPDAICQEYGADSLRLYEMFLGPLEQSKPWNTAGITGTHSFLKKLWRLYHATKDSSFCVTDVAPSKEALKTLHKTIKKVEEDITAFSFNTSVSTFMICVNELASQQCTSSAILKPLLILIAPYAPHIAEELWEKLGHTNSITHEPFPKFEAKYLVESSKDYPISFNGKMRFKLELPLDLNKAEIEKIVMKNEKTLQQLAGKIPKKVIVVPGKIVNIVG